MVRASDFLDVFVPRTCAGCGTETVSLCARCMAALDMDPVCAVPRYGTQPVFAGAAYRDVLRTVLIAYKEHDRRDTVPVLALLLARAITEALAAQPVRSSPVFLVPVPARASALRRRGANHVAVIARAAAKILCGDGLRVRCAEVLSVTGRGDQVGHGSRARRGNVAGTHAVSAAGQNVVGAWPGRIRVIVVDDIVTTGATTAESVRALKKFHITPIAVATVGITGRFTSNNQECVQ